MKQKTAQSYAMLIAAMLVFGSIGVFRRYIPLPSATLACSRGFLGALVLLVFTKLTGRKLFHGIGKRNVLLLVLSGVLIGANWILLFEAYTFTTVPIATLCYYMEPTLVILASPVVMGERLTAKKLICAVVALAGMILVSGAAGGHALTAGEIRGILLGLGAAALYASVVLLNKRITVEDAYEKTFIQLLSAAVALVP